MKTKTNYDTLLPQKGVKKILLIMKLTLFLILVTVFQVSATSIFSQGKNVSFEMHNATVRDVIHAIETQGEMSFFYNDDLVELNSQISVSFQDRPVKEALENALAQADMTYEIIKDNFVVLSPAPVTARQEQKKIIGTIRDENGEPLIGVTISVKGTTIGAITNMDGNYEIEVPDTADVLVFSFVGMKTQEVKVDSQSTIDIILVVDVIGIEEVVAIGYGVQKRINMTGSIAAIKGEELKTVNVANVSNSVGGQISGVITRQISGEPGNDEAEVLLRGTKPLVLVDGIVREWNKLNMQDIESVTVLKDATAVAPYGLQGANGVILVTTKRGKIL